MTTATADSAISAVLTEDVLTLTEARTELFRMTGRRPDKATLTRWVHRGVGGTRLEAIRLIQASPQTGVELVHEQIAYQRRAAK